MSGREPLAYLPRAPAALPPRAVARAQMCVLLILGVGFTLILSYQSEVHTVSLAEGRTPGYSDAAAARSVRGGSVESVKKPPTDVRLDSDARLKGMQSGDERPLAGIKISSRTQRKLEAEIGNSTGEEYSSESVAPVSSSPPPSKKKNSSPPPSKERVPEYQPLVKSVHSNIVSTRFQFIIKVLALNDYDSINRCLYSLSEAEYAGDEVDIHIYIDHFEVSESERRRLLATEEESESESGKTAATDNASGKSSKSDRIKRMKEKNRRNKDSVPARQLEGDSWDDSKPARLPDRVTTGLESVRMSDWQLVEEKLNEARRVLNHVESFEWKHGKKVIHYRTRTAGSQSQWLDAWWPSSDDEFALFVEDDAELSPLYYRYARSLISTYYYQPSHYDPLMYGISLQRPQIVPGKNGRPLKVDDRTRLFKYSMVGIWGQIFFPRPWKEFRRWYDDKKSHDMKPMVDGMITTDWYKEHGEKVFTPWFVKFVYSRGYFNLYTNFLRDRVLSVTHRDIGRKPSRYEGCDSVLIWENGTYDIDLWHMAANWHINRYDYCFKRVPVGRFANYSSDLGWVLESASHGTKQLLVISTINVQEILVKNWVCFLKKLGIENYVFIGEDPVLLENLARRGHAAVRFENKGGLLTTIEKEVGVISVVLEAGYSVWFARADTIWVGNPLEVISTEGTNLIGMESSKLNLVFVKSTPEITKLWSSLRDDVAVVPFNTSRWSNWKQSRQKFVNAVEEAGIQTSKLEQVTFMKEDTLSEPPNTDGGSVNGKIVVLSSGLKSLKWWEIPEKLRPLNLWQLDDDWACVNLVC